MEVVDEGGVNHERPIEWTSESEHNSALLISLTSEEQRWSGTQNGSLDSGIMVMAAWGTGVGTREA